MSDSVPTVPCEEAARHLMAYLDGELEGAPAAVVRGHLEECARCAALGDAQRRFRELLADLGGGGAGDEALRRRVEDALRAAREATGSGGA